MRALILGGNGMLGRTVVAEGRRRGATVHSRDIDRVDIRDRGQVVALAAELRPELIVNCAAFTQVDACEEQRDTAFEVNGRAVENVVAGAESVGAGLIHISTDYVFDGTAREPYGEDVATRPQSVYGESKLAGEVAALSYDQALVLRTCWLFGPDGPNFVATMRRLIRQGQLPLKVVDDQVGCPTYTGSLARAIWDLAPLGIGGILHYRDRDAVSWYGFAVEIARHLDPAAEVVPVATSEFPRPAPRPAYSVLDVGRFEAAVGRRVEPWSSGLASYLESLEENPS